MIKLIGVSAAAFLLSASVAFAQTAPGGTGVTGGGTRTEKESQAANDPSRTGIGGTETNPKEARTPGTGTSGDNPATIAPGTGGVATNPKAATAPGTGTSGDNPGTRTRPN